MFKLKNLLGFAVAAVASVSLMAGTANAQVVSSALPSVNGAPSTEGVTVYYVPDGVGTTTTALVVDPTHAAHVGWADADSLVGASWITKELDTYSGTNDPLPQYARTGNWEYDQTFIVGSIPGGGPTGALAGKLLTDDDVVAIYLNGVDVTAYYTQGATPTWQNVSTFDTSSFGGVNVGVNTLRLIVNNDASFVTGVAYNFSVVPVVPEPGLIAFGLTSGGSLVGLMLRGRLRFKSVA